MARKTNKTDHVLNLLSNGKENKEKSASSQPPVDPGKDASVSVVQSSSDSEQFADTIKRSLEEELEEMQKTAEKETSVEEPEAENTKAEEPKREEPKAAEAKAEEPEAAEPKEDEYNFASINVMERLVKESVPGYMTQFGICTCPRCVADTVALALTQLPPKYVVVNKESVSPLMSFYSKKYAGQITVEITKACMKVGEVPHHTRE